MLIASTTPAGVAVVTAMEGEFEPFKYRLSGWLVMDWLALVNDCVDALRCSCANWVTKIEWLPGWVLVLVVTENISVWLLVAVTELKSLTSFKSSKAVLTVLRANFTAA